MNIVSDIFPYNKQTMLNVLYDTLDFLGYEIERANSQRGTLIALSANEPRERIRIACSNVDLSNDRSSIQIYSEIEGLQGELLAGVLLDEIRATAKRSLKPQ